MLLVSNSKFFKPKSPCKSAFQSQLLADVSDPAGLSNDREEKKSPGSDKGGESCISNVSMFIESDLYCGFLPISRLRVRLH